MNDREVQKQIFDGEKPVTWMIPRAYLRLLDSGFSLDGYTPVFASGDQFLAEILHFVSNDDVPGRERYLVTALTSDGRVVKGSITNASGTILLYRNRAHTDADRRYLG